MWTTITETGVRRPSAAAGLSWDRRLRIGRLRPRQRRVDMANMREALRKLPRAAAALGSILLGEHAQVADITEELFERPGGSPQIVGAGEIPRQRRTLQIPKAASPGGNPSLPAVPSRSTRLCWPTAGHAPAMTCATRTSPWWSRTSRRPTASPTWCAAPGRRRPQPGSPPCAASSQASRPESGDVAGQRFALPFLGASLGFYGSSSQIGLGPCDQHGPKAVEAAGACSRAWFAQH